MISVVSVLFLARVFSVLGEHLQSMVFHMVSRHEYGALQASTHRFTEAQKTKINPQKYKDLTSTTNPNSELFNKL